MATTNINLTVGLTASKGGASINLPTTTTPLTMAGAFMIQNTQAVGVVTEPLLLGDVASTGYIYLKNLGPDTIYVSSDTPAAATGLISLKNGDANVISTRLTVIYVKSAATASNLLYGACEL
jgi:hypothetical protein